MSFAFFLRVVIGLKGSSFSEEVSEAHFSRRALVQADSRLRANSSLTPNLVNFDSIVVHAGKYTGVGNSGMFVVRMQL